MRHERQPGGQDPTPARTGAGIDRRSLLGYAAAGAAVLAVPALVGGLGAGAARAAEANGVVPDLLRGGRYPIGFWWPPPPRETTAARYAQIADAGFTFVNGGNGVVDRDLNLRMLDAAGAHRLPAVVVDSRVGDIQNHPREQWPALVKAALDDYSGHPSFAGFNIRDEPHASLFPQIGAVNDLIRRQDPTKLGYVNLFPTYASSGALGTPTYEEHLERYVAEAHPRFLSFDHYPLLGPAPALRTDYFRNFALVRRQALRSGLSYWGFILACEHLDYRLPTDAELAWQVNVSLAYGCKGIQYFTYWTPDLPSVFRQALVTVDGQLTPLYHAARRINNDHLRPLGAQLLPLTSESVTHFGEREPLPDVEPFTGDDQVASVSGDAVVLGRFHDGSRGNRRWLLVTNRSFDAPATTTLTLRGAVREVFAFDTGQEAFTRVPLRGPRDGPVLTVRLAPGDARLYRLHSDDSGVAPTTAH